METTIFFSQSFQLWRQVWAKKLSPFDHFLLCQIRLPSITAHNKAKCEMKNANAAKQTSLHVTLPRENPGCACISASFIYYSVHPVCIQNSCRPRPCGIVSMWFGEVSQSLHKLPCQRSRFRIPINTTLKSPFLKFSTVESVLILSALTVKFIPVFYRFCKKR